jgi:phosphatidylserine/phosphatidylglycerophosphate/cardiolipin synthase-like enzyme
MVAPAIALRDWFLSATERGNPYTGIDRRRPGAETAWSTGNEVRPLIHGSAYFASLVAAVNDMRRGDLLLFTDWRGDPDERLSGPGTEVSTVLCQAAERGVLVKGLIWRSHVDKIQFSEEENRHLGEEIEAAGGECVLDMRVRTAGSHHQKMVVLRHPDRPERDVAYIGGIDLCHGRRDDAAHHGDPQAAPMPDVYGPHPPWHDVQLEIRGPAVGDVEASFRERWDDPTPLSRHPGRRLADLVHGDDTRPDPLPPQLPDPPPAGTEAVQVLRTYPYRRHGYPFAPAGERSVARAYAKALRQARHLVYLEDQYLWSAEVARVFAQALAARPGLRMIAVVPAHPDQGGRFACAAQLIGRNAAFSLLRAAAGDRFAMYAPENHAGQPVYVHAKVCVIDDAWATVGSDNLNMRSWTYDSEISCAVAGELPGQLRRALTSEHLDDPAGVPLEDTFDAYARSAAALDAWYAGGCAGTRPPGRLREYQPQPVPLRLRVVAGTMYRRLCDPDGRPRQLRRAGTY